MESIYGYVLLFGGIEWMLAQRRQSTRMSGEEGKTSTAGGAMLQAW